MRQVIKVITLCSCLYFSFVLAVRAEIIDNLSTKMSADFDKNILTESELGSKMKNTVNLGSVQEAFDLTFLFSNFLTTTVSRA